MPIISISRGSYFRGKEVAKALAKELDYECVSREVVHEASDEFNIPEIKLVKALQDSPSLLKKFNRSKERYISIFKSSFLTHMLRENIVYHGLIGHFFLKDITHVLKVRINAKPEPEKLAAMLAENQREEDEFYHLQDDNEEQRRKNLHLYGKDTWNFNLYDLVISMDNFSTNDTVDMLAAVIRKEQFQETEQSRQMLLRYATQAKIEAYLSHISPRAEVKISEGNKAIISHIDGLLKSDKNIRKDFVSRIKEEMQIKDVIFKEPTKTYKGHINTFYNLDLSSE